MMLSLDTRQSNAGAKEVELFCIIWPKVGQACSCRVSLAYQLSPFFDLSLVFDAQVDVVTPVEPFLPGNGALRFR
jgi:hypothetical protein